MRLPSSCLSGLLLLTTATVGFGQTVSPAATAPVTAIVPTEEVVARPVLVKVGLNVARSFRWGGYYGIPFRVPLAVGAEYRLSPKFTLYGQLDADFATSRGTGYGGERSPLLPTGALSLGGRYYYNQAGRARDNRAHGAFVGNYLAAEMHTEMWHHYESSSLAIPKGNVELRRDYVPTLNLLWGMQRRLSRSFLFDASAGIGVGVTRSDLNFGGFSSGPVNLSGQLNIGVYFGR
jgi:hypothetical protein